MYGSDSGTATADQTRQHPEADATRDHGGGADQQERGLGGAGLRQLLLDRSLLHRLRADAVGVGVVGARGTLNADGAKRLRIAQYGGAFWLLGYSWGVFQGKMGVGSKTRWPIQTLTNARR